jgi:hypothetical protein
MFKNNLPVSKLSFNRWCTKFFVRNFAEQSKNTGKLKEKSKIPRNFKAFMMNSENKCRLIDIIFDFIIKEKARCIQNLRANKILLSRDGECHEVTSSAVNRLDHLSSNQEEAHTKVILHTLDALEKHD